MIAKARGRFIRISGMKMRQVIDLIRGKNVGYAFTILSQTPKKASGIVKKILHSAVSNAKQKGLTEDQLYVSKIFSDNGPMWKRYRAGSFGRATPILKRTAHLTIELDLKTK